MNLELKEREIEGIALLDVSGELQFGPEDLRLQDHVSSMIKEGPTKIIINLQHVQAIDPIVVGTIRLLSDECRRRSGKLVLVNPSAQRLEASLLFSLETDLGIFDSEQEAVNSFFPIPSGRCPKVDPGLRTSAQV